MTKVKQKARPAKSTKKSRPKKSTRSAAYTSIKIKSKTRVVASTFVPPPKTAISDFIKAAVSSLPRFITMVCISLIFLMLPGQNYFQTYTFGSPQTPVPPKALSPLTKPIPVLPKEFTPPALSAQSVVAIDLGSGSVLYQHQPHLRSLPASTTKIMTAVIALEEYQLNAPVTVTNADRAIGQKTELAAGETLTVHHLLYALLLDSGNDAAVTLAQHHPQGYFGFISAMNTTARRLGLTGTHFENASGIDSDQHFTTARDLAILTQYALTLPEFKTIVATQNYTITSIDGRFSHYLTNLNQLLGTVKGVVGVKTGWTEAAGECLVTLIERDNRQILIVVLGSLDRFGESKSLIDWIFNTYVWLSPEELHQLVLAESQ